MHCPFHIFNERHGELLFCRSEGGRLFSAALERGIGISQRAGDNGPGAAGWHMRRSARHCPLHSAHGHQDSLAICYLAVSSMFSHCLQMQKERAAEFVHCILQLGLVLKRKTHLLEGKPWNQSFSSPASNKNSLNLTWTPPTPTHFSFTKYFTFLLSLSKDSRISVSTCTSRRSPHVPAVWLLTQLQAEVSLCAAHGSLQQL